MNSFYMEESELLAFVIHAISEYRKDSIKEFNDSDYRLKIYYGDNSKYWATIKVLDENEKEKDAYYIYHDETTGWNYNVWKCTDMHEHPEYKGENLLKTVPYVMNFTRAKITAVLELQNWMYM